MAGREYVRDLYGKLSEWVAGYEPAAELPVDAIDTGYRNRGWQLWRPAD